MNNLIQDARYSIRTLLKTPGFVAVAVASLGLGIAANTAVFSWLDRVLIRPLPGVADSKRIVSIKNTAPNGDLLESSYLDYRDFRDQSKTLSGVIAFRELATYLGDPPQTERVWSEMVSGNFFDVLGVHALAGRTFSTEEQAEKPGAFPVAVISERLWKRQFQSDPAVVGSTVRLNRQPFTIVGVVPSEFKGTLPGLTLDLWFPIMMQSQVTGDWNWVEEDRKSRPLRLMARLSPGATVEEANAEINSIAGTLAEQYPPTNMNVGARAISLANSPDGTQGLLKVLLFVLSAVAGIVLLIVCANVGNLLLSRAVARQKEFGIRLSLGAGRGTLARQLLVEAFILSAAGGVTSILAAKWLAGAIDFLLPATELPTDLGSASSFDGLTFAFTFGLCLAAAVLCAMAPATQFLKSDLLDWLKEGTRGASSGARSRNLRGVLVACEIALALMAIVGAGLFLKSFRNSRLADPGFQPNGVLLAGLEMSGAGYTADQAFIALRRIQDQVGTAPGVVSACLSENVPLGFDAGSWEDLNVAGYVPRTGENMKIRRNLISPGYFQTLEMPLLEGRDFTERDDRNAARVAIVNQTFVRRFLTGGGQTIAIGRKFRGWGEDITIVGVVKDTKYHSLGEPATPFFYVPIAQRFSRNMSVAVLARTAGNSKTFEESLRSQIKSVDPNIGISQVAPLIDYMSASYFVQTLGANLLSVLAAVSLVLAMLGLYAVTGYSVTQRTHEIGIRMAIGARPFDILRMVLRQGAVLAFAGLVAGLGLSYLLSRVSASLLFEVSSTDPLIFIGGSAFLYAFAMFATWLPGRRAAKMNPLDALHWE